MRLALLTLLLVPGSSWAAGDCPDGNLLAGLKVHSKKGVRATKRLTDGKLPPDGDAWNTDRVSTLPNGRSWATFDLGRDVAIRAVLLQGDNNDTYVVSLSEDGEAWSPVWTAPKVPDSGMRVRHGQLDAHGRYLRVGTPKGDRSYSLGEVQAWCRVPAEWPPTLKRTKPGKRAKKGPDKRKLNAVRKILLAGISVAVFAAFLWRERDWSAGWTALGLAAAAVAASGWWTWDWWGLSGAALLVGGVVLMVLKRGPPGDGAWRWLERSALLGVALSAALSWSNYGTFHGSRVIHLWDTFHYYAGAKYFAENRYTRIYHCAVIGELDDGRREEMDDRKLRDLRDNTLGDVARIFDEADVCRDVFADDRWAAMRQDLRLFRAHMGTKWFKKMFMDHGFNATPLWTTMGRPLASLGWRAQIPEPALEKHPANLKGKNAREKAAISAEFKAAKTAFYTRIGWLIAIDFGLLAGIFLLVGWAFGLRAMTLALVVFGVGYPWDYHFTGGSFGRVPWMFMATLGVCLLKKGHSAWGGAGLTASALLRVFPAAMYGGLAVKIAWHVVRDRALSGAHLRLIAGSAASLVLLVGLSSAMNGGVGVWGEFLDNSFKHKETRLTNHMGLPTLISYDHSLRARRTKDDTLDDPFEAWKDGRRSTLEDRRWLWVGSLVLLFGLLGRIGRDADDWEVAALGTVFIVGVFELTCYYYCFVILLAPVCLKRLTHVGLLLIMAAATQWVHLGIGWYDVQYTVESAVVMGFYLILLLDLAFDGTTLRVLGRLFMRFWRWIPLTA